MMLSITRHKIKLRSEDRSPPPFLKKTDERSNLNDTLDSAFSSVFRTSLILNQVDSRLQALNLEHLDHPPNQLASTELKNVDIKHKNLTVRKPISSTGRSSVAYWLTGLKTDSNLIPSENACQSSDNLLDDILTSYEDSIESTEYDYSILPETPVSMRSSYFKLPSNHSSTSTDNEPGNYLSVQTTQDLSSKRSSSHSLSAGRDNKKQDEKNEYRTQTSTGTESNKSRLSIKGRVRSLSILSSRISKSSIETSSTNASSPANDFQCNSNTADEQRRSCNSVAVKETFLQRLVSHHANDSSSTARETGNTVNTGDIFCQDIPTLCLPIPYSLPKQCEIEEKEMFHHQTDNKGIEEMQKMNTVTHQEYDFEDEQCRSGGEDEVNQRYQFQAVSPQTFLSGSWTASNVFEYYFDSNTSQYDTHHGIRYDGSQMDSSKVSRIEGRRNTWNRSQTNTSKEDRLDLPDTCYQLTHSINTEDDTYPSDILYAYFRIDGLPLN
ncbi:hypothetical protein K450DRAFT_218570 [Umbelopsis ramanniana AG]|uniref:Uncharacterized protein n=1 Tax=Umbelopsis ramanniana AG TaxID=1314678 RepID=A0AAD5EHZ1_UMBRA|nr:uncharacterized protein K450DRAFT_218570 [Umbelopsis ramanniana AG]KAI8584188.1 hypothetical protein K450DRAFT_218570 [Umbelopsis ramanniana AG]